MVFSKKKKTPKKQTKQKPKTKQAKLFKES